MQFLHGREWDLLALIQSRNTSDFSQAACRDSDVDIYHPSDEQVPDAGVLDECSRCIVRMDCLALALRTEDSEARSGWYGGFGPEDRDTIAGLLTAPGGGRAPSELALTARRLVNDGWRINDVAELLGYSRRTVQRYLRSVT
ncbi:WhiB family transcriptional regulator [Kitasatospora sp. NPDC088160]|uniref:WhiB family transcriptional regulator n=1 Tax=Kitasatospora sp. NPDC088160 TaxID=3364072 RepID=UPI0038125225